jgi:hypothetical protein
MAELILLKICPIVGVSTVPLAARLPPMNAQPSSPFYRQTYGGPAKSIGVARQSEIAGAAAQALCPRKRDSAFTHCRIIKPSGGHYNRCQE